MKCQQSFIKIGHRVTNRQNNVDDVGLQNLLALPRSPAIGEREGGLMKRARDGPSVSAEHRVKGCIPGNKVAEPFQTLLPGITVSWNKRNETQFKYE